VRRAAAALRELAGDGHGANGSVPLPSFPSPFGRPALAKLLLSTLLALGLLGCGRPELTDMDIVALDAIALRAELAAGRVSALRVTQAYLRRIAAVDDAGPMLGAVIEINPDAEAIARRLDEQLASGVLGPLHGVPVLLKANIDTADAMATSAGSLALAEHRALADAEIVTRLRDAGAVILGKTNLSEWANFRSTRSTSGWSSLGGQTRNPYVLDRNPCGSSSGSAVAVAARLAPLAVGTETDGSIVCPAGVNGVVGIKPTIGTVSQRGIVPIAHSQDTAGPLARTAADAALLLSVLAEASRISEAGAASSAAGLRVGVVRNYNGAGLDTAVETAFAESLRWLERDGVALVDPVPAAFGAAVGRAELTILLAEFRDDLGAYLAKVERGPRTLDQLIAFNSERSAEVMPHFGQELLVAARDGGGTTDAAYAAAIRVAADARTTLATIFNDMKLDVLVAPTNGRAWQTDYVAGDQIDASSSRIAAVTGYPSVAVPVALVGELPLSLSLIGKPGDESRLVNLAVALERARGPFPEPRFLPSIGE
jgi:amidase